MDLLTRNSKMFNLSLWPTTMMTKSASQSLFHVKGSESEMTKRRRKIKKKSAKPAKLRKNLSSVKQSKRLKHSNNSSSRSKTQPSLRCISVPWTSTSTR